jgi:hypothetical protein
MIISFEEAFSLLKKWRDERRVIQAGLIASQKTGACALGRIEHLDNESVRIDAGSIRKIGRRNALTLEFSEAMTFRFEDWRDAPPDLAEEIRQTFESFLFIELGNCNCELYAAKTGDEFAAMDQS